MYGRTHSDHLTISQTKHPILAADVSRTNKGSVTLTLDNLDATRQKVNHTILVHDLCGPAGGAPLASTCVTFPHPVTKIYSWLVKIHEPRRSTPRPVLVFPAQNCAAHTLSLSLCFSLSQCGVGFSRGREKERESNGESASMEAISSAYTAFISAGFLIRRKPSQGPTSWIQILVFFWDF